MARRQHPALSSFERGSLALIAGITLGTASASAYAQSTAAPAASSSAAASDDPRAAFTKADKNGDGKLSRDEAASLPAVAAGFERADSDKDGSLSLAEFGRAMKM